MPSIGLWLAEDAAGPGDGRDRRDGLSLAERLRGGDAPGVKQAVPNLYLRLAPAADPYTPNDPMRIDQWYLDRIRMAEAWGVHRGDPGTTIVVIDTGCDPDHPDLAPKLDPGLDVVDGDTDPRFEPGFQGNAHGTACAGLAAAATDNALGMSGACPECRLRCVRLLTDAAVPLAAHVEAFNFALEVGAAVVSNSWGFLDPMPVPQALADAIDNVFQSGRGGKGALVLFAAGNDNREIGPEEMQALPSVLAIGAINYFDDKTSFTNSGAAVELVAPVGTVTADISGAEGYDPSDYTAQFGGTSSACPVTAGVAGVLASYAPERTAAELYEVMIRTARPAPLALPDENGHDPVYGYGVVDPVSALDALLNGGVGGSGGSGGTGPTRPTADTAEADAGCACAVAPGARSWAGDLGATLGAAAFLGYAARRRRQSRSRRGR
jgi:MYXO-CTERM domain-containing protein